MSFAAQVAAFPEPLASFCLKALKAAQFDSDVDEPYPLTLPPCLGVQGIDVFPLFWTDCDGTLIKLYCRGNSASLCIMEDGLLLVDGNSRAHAAVAQAYAHMRSTGKLLDTPLDASHIRAVFDADHLLIPDQATAFLPGLLEIVARGQTSA